MTTFNSAQLNENQFEDTQYAVLALQRSINGFDGQISYFTRYDQLHYSPDPLGDLLINYVASNVVRQILHQRHPGRRLVCDQPSAYGPHRLHRQWRTSFCRELLSRRARCRRRPG